MAPTAPATRGDDHAVVHRCDAHQRKPGVRRGHDLADGHRLGARAADEVVDVDPGEDVACASRARPRPPSGPQIDVPRATLSSPPRPGVVPAWSARPKPNRRRSGTSAELPDSDTDGRRRASARSIQAQTPNSSAACTAPARTHNRAPIGPGVGSISGTTPASGRATRHSGSAQYQPSGRVTIYHTNT